MSRFKALLRPSPRRDHRNSLRVLIADRCQLLLDLLASELERRGHNLVGAVDNGRRAVELARRRHPQVALLDLSMPVMGGVEAAREILRVAPHTGVLLLAEYADEGIVREALRVGVLGLVPKAEGVRQLVRAIRDVSEGVIHVSPCYAAAVRAAIARPNGHGEYRLTRREEQLLVFIADGRSTKQAAVGLAISVRTAEEYRASLMEKLGIHDTAGLVRYAIRRGLIGA
jgi:DNA-binding NarL/FixJ family response regulator